MHHGSKNFDVTAPRSRFYQGGFGRIFTDLEPWAPEGVPDHLLEEHFLAFASEKMVEFPGKRPDEIIADDTTQQAGSISAPFNSAMPSGYVYFGQFVDHDLTLDVTPLSDAEVDPNRLHNFRTPRLDLDCLYGQGPDAQPHLYEHRNGAFTGKLLVTPLAGADLGPLEGRLFDLQRNSEGRALIGDPRNDENVIVAQIHLAFTLAHNKLVDIAISKAPAGQPLTPMEAFNQARRTLRWLYQWIVWNDFVMRITERDVHKAALRKKQQDGRQIWKPGYDDVYSWRNTPFMPVEFSAAGYRFGHSMVRNAYQTNLRRPPAGAGTFFPIFSIDHTTDLTSGRPLDLRRVLQWDWFLQMTSSVNNFPQRARKIDRKLSNALMFLPEDPASPSDPTKILNVLAARNLTRGVRMKLPSGPDAARHLGIPVVPLDADEPATLWYYILKEAEEGGGNKLGDLGSIIVCATFAGILKGDPLSWFNQQPLWEPDEDPLLKGQPFNEDAGNEGNPEWGLPAIIRMSGLPFDGGAFLVPAPATPEPVTV
ncbi:peroxidase family protein [Rhizobium binxianense]